MTAVGMSATPTLDMIDRAFAIADDAMITALVSYGSGAIDSPIYGMCDGNGREVRSVAEASAELREAVEWLVARGLAKLFSDKQGDTVELLDAEVSGG